MSERNPVTRHASIIRLAAVCLLVLAACPFTAPFSTFDAGNAVLHTGIDEGGDSLASKLAGDTAIPVFAGVGTAGPQVAAAVAMDPVFALVTGAGPSLFPLRL